MQTAATSPLLQFLTHLIIAGNIFALLVGLIMLVSPERLGALFKVTDRWVSTRRTFEQLDYMHDTDGVAFRYPRVLGGVLIAGALFILIKGGLFAAGTTAAAGGRLLARIFGGRLPAPAWEVLWITLTSVVLFGALLAFAVGLLAFFRTETLQRWSELANRWVTTNRYLEPLDTPHYAINRIVHEKPRVWGGAIALAASVALVLLIWYVRR